MNIGQLAKVSGVNTKFIRYYESIELIPAAQRTDSNYRVYCSEDVHLLKFMGKIGSQDISNAFVAYNTGVGGYRTLMTMRSGADAYRESATGVTGKGNEARAYAGFVTAAYNRMFA